MRAYALLLLAVGATSAHAAPFNFTFDTDNQGWRRADFGSSNYTLTDAGEATWNAGGFIDGPDFSNWAFHMSPAFVGNQSDLVGETLSFDYLTQNGGGLSAFIVFTSGAGSIYRDATWTADPNFVNYSFILDEGHGWQYFDGVTSVAATNAHFNAVFSSLNRLGITADTANGGDYTAVDNVVAGVPEPTTLGLLGLGALALRRRKQP